MPEPEKSKLFKNTELNQIEALRGGLLADPATCAYHCHNKGRRPKGRVWKKY